MKNYSFSRPLRILLADGHPLFRLGVRMLLEQTQLPRVSIVGEVDNGESAVSETARLQPDLVLLEVNLPHLSGAEATRQILRILPQTRILALSSCSDPKSILGMIRAGASGYLVKTIPADELVRALMTVSDGNTYFSRDAATVVLASLSDTSAEQPTPSFHLLNESPILTKREMEILHFVAEEKSNQEIARMLYLSPRTVETHKRNMLLKLKMKNVAGLVKYYLQSVRRDALSM